MVQRHNKCGNLKCWAQDHFTPRDRQYGEAHKDVLISHPTANFGLGELYCGPPEAVVKGPKSVVNAEKKRKSTKQHAPSPKKHKTAPKSPSTACKSSPDSSITQEKATSRSADRVDIQSLVDTAVRDSMQQMVKVRNI